MTKAGKAALALAAVAVAAVAAVGGGSAAPQKTVTIGWAYDGVGNMAAYDGPALVTAQQRIAQVNKTSATKLKLITCNTQGNKPAIAKACARKLLGQGADVIMTTCDVDYAAPVVQESINAGKLTVAACIGTDQMGPKRFGAKGKLAFSFGNVAQDEGSAMAEFAWKKGWRSTPSSSTSAMSSRRSRHAGSGSAARS
jgi:branched-chain amino acid transport system substrate-binding protein